MYKNKKIVLLIVFLALLGAVMTTLVFVNNRSSPPVKKVIKTNDSNPSEVVNFDPPTSEDTQRAQNNKNRIIDEQNSSTTENSGSQKTVKPVITYAGLYNGEVQVGAYVSDTLDNSGICKAILTQGTTTLTKTVSAVTNANSMDCPEMVFAKSDLKTNGDWTVKVVYSSNSAAGTSDPKVIQVN